MLKNRLGYCDQTCEKRGYIRARLHLSNLLVLIYLCYLSFIHACCFMYTYVDPYLSMLIHICPCDLHLSVLIHIYPCSSTLSHVGPNINIILISTEFFNNVQYFLLHCISQLVRGREKLKSVRYSSSFLASFAS